MFQLFFDSLLLQISKSKSPLSPTAPAVSEGLQVESAAMSCKRTKLKVKMRPLNLQYFLSDDKRRNFNLNQKKRFDLERFKVKFTSGQKNKLNIVKC